MWQLLGTAAVIWLASAFLRHFDGIIGLLAKLAFFIIPIGTFINLAIQFYGFLLS